MENGFRILAIFLSVVNHQKKEKTIPVKLVDFINFIRLQFLKRNFINQLGSIIKFKERIMPKIAKVIRKLRYFFRGIIRVHSDVHLRGTI